MAGLTRTCASCGAVNRIPAKHLTDAGKCSRCKAALPATAAPVDVDSVAMFDAVLAEARGPVLVDFWAAWCGPCRMVAPEVAAAAAQLAGKAVVLKVDTEKLPALAARYHVTGIPNFAVFDGGALVHQQAGAIRAPQIVELAAAATRARVTT